MAQNAGRSVGQAALFAIIFGAIGGGGAWIVGGGLQGRACILVGLFLAALMFFLRLIGILADRR